MYDLIVIGWGKAGKTLAAKLAAKGKKIAVVEENPKMYGGTCINVGCLPTKSLVHSAKLISQVKNYGIDGDYQSIIGDKILDDKKLDYEIVAFLNVYGTVSFRSKNNIDVSEIAKKLGILVGYSGGGHKHASGCRICDKDEMKKKMMEIFEHSMNRIKIL